ncbi:MAG: Fic family protein [bacterium]|nr:Fic family protein [bacterium]
MAIQRQLRERIQGLQQAFRSLREGKEALLAMIDEAEVAESVYNSNAIENSTLTLKETERILLEQELSRDVSLREVFEAKNLARVVEYIRVNAIKRDLDKEMVLFLHQMLIGGIDDVIAGRFRKAGEYVRVGTHIAPAPEHVERMIGGILASYGSDLELYALDKVAKFHVDFETVHPFLDGNGRIGRVIINYQLFQLGLPSIIIRDKEKQIYYEAFREDRSTMKNKIMERVIARGLLESLHKRIAYLEGKEIILLADFARQEKQSLPALLNAARRQTVAAFREKGVWKIGV